MDFTDCALRFIIEKNWEDFPLDVQHQSKRCLLDTSNSTKATRPPYW
jgi:hypothetical protein